MDEEALAAVDPDDRAARIDATAAELRAAGAHAVIESVADLPAALARLPIG